MKPLSFVKSLLTGFTKSTVLEDCRMTKLVLATTTTPAYETSMRLFATRKVESPQLRQDWDRYKNMVRGAQGPNLLVAIHKNLKNIAATLDYIEEVIERDYNEEIMAAGLTYYKASTLQLLESIGFVLDYANRYLNYALIMETATLLDEEEDLAVEASTHLTPAEMRFISDRFIDFCSVMTTLTKPVNSIKTELARVPDVVVTPDGDKVAQSTMGAARLDPFNHGLIAAWINPIYHIRVQIANWQVARVNAAKAEKEMLELRVLRMKRAQDGKNDPALEREIEHTVKRIDDARRLIREKEEEYA